MECSRYCNKHTRQHLRDCIFNYNPDIIFISETKNKAVKTQKFLVPLGYPNVICIDIIGKSGGLAFMWKDGIGIKFIHQSSNMVHVIINYGVQQLQWFYHAYMVLQIMWRGSHNGSIFRIRESL